MILQPRFAFRQGFAAALQNGLKIYPNIQLAAPLIAPGSLPPLPNKHAKL